MANQLTLKESTVPTLFDPKKTKVKLSALDSIKAHARRIKDWPALKQAVDEQIKEQRDFVEWWNTNIREPGQPKKELMQSGINSLLTVPQAEEDSGIKQPQVSKWTSRLKNPARYEQMLYGTAHRKAWAEVVERTRAKETEGIVVNPKLIALYPGDMMNRLRDIKPADLVIADPPYNVTAHSWDKRGTPSQFIEETKRWLGAVKKILKPKFHLFWFCSPRFAADVEMVLRPMLPIKSRIVWHRRNMSEGSDAADQFIDTWEMILHCGNKPLNFSAQWTDERFDVQTFAVPQSNFTDQKRHPTQKPLGLIQRLVEFGSEPGCHVVDPFAGSGTTGHASALAGERRCSLIEQKGEYVEVIKARLLGIYER